MLAIVLLCGVCVCLRPGSPDPGACSLPCSVLCSGGNVQGTDLCYQALVAWPGGSGNSASILMWEILNIYSWSSWVQYHSSSPRLWRARRGSLPSLLPPVLPQPFPFPSSEAPARTLAPPQTSVPAARLTGFRVLVVKGERTGGWEGK